MNRELLSELYQEAVKVCVDAGSNPDGTNKSWLWEEAFAELIICKCLEACSRANEIRRFIPPSQQQVVLSCMEEIEKTFDRLGNISY